jgi:PST family polysaccharide transporter
VSDLPQATPAAVPSDSATGKTQVGQKMASAVGWMMLFKLVDRGVGFVSVLILARLLVPADFGLVAMATSVVALLELLSAFSFDVALIGRRNPTREHYDTAWTLNAIAGLSIAGLIVMLAWPAGIFYHETRLTPVMLVLAVASAVQGFDNVGVVAFRRDLDFRKEFVYLTLKRLATFAVVVPAAFLWRSHWALVVGIVSGRLLSVMLSYAIHPFRPRFSLQARRDLFGFSSWMLMNNLLGFVKERAPDFIVGRALGPAPLGLYSMGTELASIPTAELSAPLNRALLPGYAALSGQESALQSAYLKAFGVLALFVVPAGFGVSSTAPDLVVTLLGEKWAGAVPIVEIMAIHGIVVALQAIGYAVMLASNRPSIPARLNAVHVCVLVTALLVLTPRFGITGAAFGYLGTGLLMAPVNYYFVLAALGLSAARVLGVIWRTLAAAGVMAATLTVGREVLGARPDSALARLLVEVPVGALAYAVTLAGLWLLSGRPAGPERAFVELVRSRLPGRS